MGGVRTTLDLPEDVHRAVVALARDRAQPMGVVVAELVREALGTSEELRVEVDDETGLPLVRIGRPVTAEDVRALDDEG
jgi:hypothetical protein